MTNVILGQIMMFGGNFAPKGFAFCNGQNLSIAQNTALFTLLGTTYGGDGVQTFALPNLQSALPVHQGTGQGLSTYQLGQAGGTPQVTLTSATMPQHTHLLIASQAAATDARISTNVVPGTVGGTTSPLFYAATQTGQPPVVPELMATQACSITGGSQGHNNLMPSLCISFVIALQGQFPSRN
ncbi:MAG: tail fiber protein [Pseudolabrys sp.]|nr:tail fiber protein [Pseudolabrys sp.]